MILVSDQSNSGLETLKRLYTLADEMEIKYDKLLIVVNRMRTDKLPDKAAEVKAYTHADEVIGLPDDTWGEAVTAVAGLRERAALDLAVLRAWCRDRLSVYKIPQRLHVVAELPRNAMGKVTKPAVRASLSTP